MDFAKIEPVLQYSRQWLRQRAPDTDKLVADIDAVLRANGREPWPEHAKPPQGQTTEFKLRVISGVLEAASEDIDPAQTVTGQWVKNFLGDCKTRVDDALQSLRAPK